MYTVGVILVLLVGIIFVTIRYLEQGSHTNSIDDIIFPAIGVFAISLASWGTIVIGIVVGITVYIYTKYKKKKETKNV